jgi:molybdopterin-guanine dinucleotide biosynthesis protein A
MITGVLLAGGQNRRMGGRHKALLPINGVPLLAIQLQEMARLCEQILIVTNTPDLFEPIISGFELAKVTTIPDIIPGRGPLSGIHAACRAAIEDRLWIVGCDMPFLSAAAAEALNGLCEKTNADAAIPVIDDKLQPLHGIYDKRIESITEELLLQEKYRLMGLLERIRWQPADQAFFVQKEIGLSFTVNLNTPDDFNEAAQIY